MKFHKLANIFPMMRDEEFRSLVEDIKKNDQLEPIYIFNDKIIDGRNRYNACKQLGIEPHYKQWDGKEENILSFVLSENLERRHLTSAQRAAIALEILPLLEEQAKKRQKEHGNTAPGRKKESLDQKIDEVFREPQATEQAAKLCHTNRQYVNDMKKIHQKAPEKVEEIKEGKAKIEDVKREIIRQEYIKKNESIEATETKIIEGVYDVIVIDPPWPIKKIERNSRPMQCELDYSIMTIEEIYNIKIPKNKDCHLWLWTTQKFLPYAFSIIKSWGFNYICTFIWQKNGGFQPFGLPQYNCEFAIYGRYGNPVFIELKDFKLCFNAPRGKHSEKPDEFYKMITRVTSGRRLDMFNRRKIEGFETWGKESA